MRVSLSRGVGTGQLSCRSAAPFPKQGAWEPCSPHGREPVVEWPGVPAGRRTERAEQHPLKATWAPAWVFARAARMCHLSFQVGAGCLWTGLVNRKGSRRPGRQGALPCVSQCLPASPQAPSPSATQGQPGLCKPCLELGGSSGPWVLRAAVLGFPPDRHRPRLDSARSLLSPWALQAPALGGTSPSTRRGRWLFPQRLPGSAAEGRAPDPHRDQRSRPLGGTSWVARCNRTIPATFSAAHVKPADLRLPNVQIGRPQGALPVSNVDERRRGPRGGVGVGDSRGVALAAREGRAGVRLAEL